MASAVHRLGELPAALGRLASDGSDEQLRRVYEVLLGSDLVVPLARAAESAGEHERVELMAARDSEGAPALVAFSSPATLERWPEPAGVAVRSATETIEAALTNGVRLAIDPAGPVILTLARWELRRLAAGALPDPAESDAGAAEDACTAVGAPVRAVTELEATLRQRLGAHPHVREAWLLDGDPIAGRRQLVVALLFDAPADEAAGQATIDALHDELTALAPPRTVVNYTVVREDGKLRALRERVPPAYSRDPGISARSG